MTHDEMKLAVAEASGWERIHEMWKSPLQVSGKMQGPWFNWYEVPDYPKDLNAIRAAALAQPLEVRKAMRYWLWQLEDQMTAHLASAETMTKALLLALGKWKEPPSCEPGRG